MDLTLPIGDFVLNVRVAMIIKTDKGFIFEKHRDNYYFVVGGRVKAGESSKEAIKREVFEELGILLKNFYLRAVIENFFISGVRKFHEICFVYQTEDILEKEFSQEFFVYNKEEINNIDLKPEIMKEVIIAGSKGILHVVSKNT